LTLILVQFPSCHHAILPLVCIFCHKSPLDGSELLFDININFSHHINIMDIIMLKFNFKDCLN
jgi:hypothetical protein